MSSTVTSFICRHLHKYNEPLWYNLVLGGNMTEEFDLVDEMMWEDLVEFETLEDAGLENPPEFDSVGSAQRAYYADEA